jgi:hypothetical protein
MTGTKAGGWWWTAVVLSTLIALYAAQFLVRGSAAFTPDLAPSFHRHFAAIMSHALGGAICLGLGALQFNQSLLRHSRVRHRAIGYIYLGGALLAGGSGLYLAFFSYGGLVTHLGFGLLALLTLGTTVTAFVAIRAGDVRRHLEWMRRSFGLIFAAVTLRLELPLLVLLAGEFAPAYRVVAWLCWVPNLLAAEWLVRRSRFTAPRTIAEAVTA